MTRTEIKEKTRLKKEAKALAVQARKDAATLAKKEKTEAKERLKAEHKLALETARKEKLEKALHEKELKEQAKKEKEDRIQREQITREYNYGKFDLEKIKELIRRGESNEYIRKGVLYNIRNAPFEISAAVNFRLPFMPNHGKTREHVNGRTAFATYFLWAIAKGEINSVDDAVMFYKTYCIWILTDDEFNLAIKPYQNDEGAIKPETYITLYEHTYGPLSDLAKNNFQVHFMYTDYGRITRDDLINFFRK